MARAEYDAVRHLRLTPALHAELERTLGSYLLHLLEHRCGALSSCASCARACSEGLRRLCQQGFSRMFRSAFQTFMARSMARLRIKR